MSDDTDKRLTLREYLKNYLDTHGMSGRAFAEKIGISQSYIHYILRGERDENKISMEILQKIAYGLDITLTELMELLEIKCGEELSPKELKTKRIIDIVNDITDETDLEKVLSYVELFTHK